jgi:hypothetical protein
MDCRVKPGNDEPINSRSRGALCARAVSAHDPEKWSPVFGQDHAQLKILIPSKNFKPAKSARSVRRASPVRSQVARMSRAKSGNGNQVFNSDPGFASLTRATKNK